MKKIFALMTVMAALALMTSCSKDKDPEEISKNITGTDWAGFMTEERKDMGNWVNNGQQNFVVIHFIGTGTAPKEGGGWEKRGGGWRNRGTQLRLEQVEGVKPHLTLAFRFLWRKKARVRRKNSNTPAALTAATVQKAAL